MKGRLEQVFAQNVKQIQRLILSPQMQQALHLLQLPVQELGSVIEEELTQNPILEFSDEENAFSEEEFEILRAIDEEGRSSPAFHGEREEEDLKAFIENTIAHEYSLFDHLMRQAHEVFTEPHQRQLAESIIGNLDHDGFLSTNLEEIAALADSSVEELTPILSEIQTFDPLGVGARSVQEALLIQLRGVGKGESLAFRIIQDHYEDVVHNRIPLIAKACSRPNQEIRQIITEEIASLDLHPGTNQAEGHYRQTIHHLIPDLTITYSEGEFSILINEEHVPSLRLNRSYLQMLQDNNLPTETRSYIQEKIASGKWLLRNLHERHQTLYRIAEQLIQNQVPFFSSPNGNLVPLTMKEIAEKLELHESTVARAVANKYVSCMRGILPLRSFFTHAYTTESGESISSQTVKELLIKILENEDKRSPLSDETLSSLIKAQGIPCARRTIAKYRQELNIGNTTQRRIH
jgi:RNA polymerase sigma-54 factor